MNERIDVIMPTRHHPHSRIAKVCLKSLPYQYELFEMDQQHTWPSAVNAQILNSRNDVLVMDDDVYLTPDTFSNFAEFYPMADIIGFKLLFPNGTIQHAGGVFSANSVGHRHYGEIDTGQADKPVYLAHVTTSLAYIKRGAIDKIGGMATDYNGMQMEDVDFCLRAIKAGLKILYLPNPAIHLESATKIREPQFRIGMTVNWLEVKRRHLTDPAFLAEVMAYPRPVDA